MPAGQSWAIIAYNPASALHNFKKSLMSTNRPLRPTVDVHPTEIAVFAVAAEHGNIGTAGVSQVSSQQVQTYEFCITFSPQVANEVGLKILCCPLCHYRGLNIR